MNNLAEEQQFEDETVAEALEKAHGKEIDTADNDDGFEIEVVDDLPEEHQGRPRAAKDAEVSESNDEDEIKSYSESVQKRIKKITWEREEKDRQRIEAENMREEALRYAQQIKKENEELRKTLEEGEGVLVNQAKGRVAAELEKARAEAKAAYEIGDADAMIAANERAAKLIYEAEKYNNYRPQQRQQKQEVAPQPQYQQPTPQPNRPSDRALKWAQRNDWFEKDSEMTGYAYGLHEKLVKSGVAPDSEEYYNEIDTAVRRVFPDRFDDVSFEETAPQRQAGNVVAPAARSGKKPRKVQLTSTQVSLAKRLGLTNEQYAAQLMREMK